MVFTMLMKFEDFLMSFWTKIVENMIPWKELDKKELSKKDLREQYIATQAVVIQAFGIVGAYLLCHREYMDDYHLSKIQDINWKRNCDDWKLRVIRSNGRMINNTNAILLAGNVIKKHMEIPLTEDEKTAEDKFIQELR